MSSSSISPSELGNLENAELSMLRLKGIGVCFALDDLLFEPALSAALSLRQAQDRFKFRASPEAYRVTSPDQEIALAG